MEKKALAGPQSAPHPGPPQEPTLLRRLMEPIRQHLENPNTTEVVVNRPGEVGVEANGAWSWHSYPELSFDRLDAIGILAAMLTNRDVDGSQPLCTSTLPGGERIQICRPAATASGIISLTIRKPAKHARKISDPDFNKLFDAARSRAPKAVALKELVALRKVGDMEAFFRLARKERMTVGICGRTGSGKTDLAKRLLQETPLERRIVTIEDTPETGGVGPSNMVNLFYGDGRAKLSPVDCLNAALRMRPDEIHLSEVRGAEAFAFLRAVMAGHPGSITTWHAEEGKEIEALVAMVKQHEAGRSLDDVEGRIRTFMDIIVWCDRNENGFVAP